MYELCQVRWDGWIAEQYVCPALQLLGERHLLLLLSLCSGTLQSTDSNYNNLHHYHHHNHHPHHPHQHFVAYDKRYIDLMDLISGLYCSALHFSLS